MYRTWRRGQHFSWSLTTDQRMEWTQWRKANQAQKGRCPSESNFSCHQGKSCDDHRSEALFLEGSSTARLPCVYSATPLAEVPLGQCHSNSWPAKLPQRKVPNWESSSWKKNVFHYRCSHWFTYLWLTKDTGGKGFPPPPWKIFPEAKALF